MSPTVLVIDDDGDIQELVRVRLKQGREPLELLHAVDAATGLTLARQRRPEVILLDLDLPGTGGLEVCRQLQADPALNGVPIIILTGTSDVETKVAALEAGATDYVTKPFDGVELRARVQAALRMRRFRAQQERAAHQSEQLLRLAGATESSWDERLKTVLRDDSRTLGVARVSYWRLSDGGSAIACDALYSADTGAFNSGQVLHAKDYPRYFEALRKAAPIVADDANQHRDTSEFSASYLQPAGIGAMMDVPVFVRGELAGVVCHEHVGGQRAWADDEQQFAVSIGHLISLALEAEHRRRAEDALRQSEARFRAIAQVSPAPLLIHSLDGRFLWSNSAFAQLIGAAEPPRAGWPVANLYAEPSDLASLLGQLAQHKLVERKEVRLTGTGREPFWAMVSLRPFVFEDQPAVIVGLADLSEQKRLADVLRHSAMHDALTGLPNRAMLFDLLRAELGRAQRDRAYRFGVLYFDLDGFKPINDRFGHALGDQLLVSLSQRLNECLRPMDTAARVGGDEFAVLIANVEDRPALEHAAARIQAALEAPHQLGDVECRVGASIGVLLCDAQYADASAVLRAADAAMYLQKRERRARGS